MTIAESNQLAGISVHDEADKEKDWLYSQIEGHIFFGPACNYFSSGWVTVLLLLVHIAIAYRAMGDLQAFLECGALLVLAGLSYRMSRKHQALIGWCLVKALAGVGSLAAFAVGGLICYFSELQASLHMILLAIIWIPGLEFMPKLSDRQKLISVARLAATSLVIYFLLDSAHIR